MRKRVGTTHTGIAAPYFKDGRPTWENPTNPAEIITTLKWEKVKLLGKRTKSKGPRRWRPPAGARSRVKMIVEGRNGKEGRDCPSKEDPRVTPERHETRLHSESEGELPSSNKEIIMTRDRV